VEWVATFSGLRKNAFEACKEVMESRIKQPAELAWAFDELEKARTECNSDISDQAVNS
jgi:recombination protein RecT